MMMTMSFPGGHQVGLDNAKSYRDQNNCQGTTPIFGSCGTAGGIPAGCHGDYSGHFGDCCTDHCDAYALGLNAEQYDWPNVFVTEWEAGSYQEVQWYVSANHAGGYSYRLCKMPHGGVEDLTEECFQENQLDFVGDKQWVIYNNPGHWDDERFIP